MTYKTQNRLGMAFFVAMALLGSGPLTAMEIGKTTMAETATLLGLVLVAIYTFLGGGS